MSLFPPIRIPTQVPQSGGGASILRGSCILESYSVPATQAILTLSAGTVPAGQIVEGDIYINGNQYHFTVDNSMGGSDMMGSDALINILPSLSGGDFYITDNGGGSFTITTYATGHTQTITTNNATWGWNYDVSGTDMGGGAFEGILETGAYGKKIKTINAFYEGNIDGSATVSLYLRDPSNPGADSKLSNDIIPNGQGIFVPATGAMSDYLNGYRPGEQLVAVLVGAETSSLNCHCRIGAILTLE